LISPEYRRSTDDRQTSLVQTHAVHVVIASLINLAKSLFLGSSRIIGYAIVRINKAFLENNKDIVNVLGQQFIFKKGLKEFKQEGMKATKTEVKQLVTRNCFCPIHISYSQRKKKSTTCAVVPN